MMTCSNKNVAMTSRKYGAPFGMRSVAQASSSQPESTKADFVNLSWRTHAATQTMSAKKAGHARATELGRAAAAGRLATCTVIAAPAC